MAGVRLPSLRTFDNERAIRLSDAWTNYRLAGGAEHAAQLQPANTMSTASRRASNPAGARGLAIAAGSTSPEPA
jgi:hypothetical protein